MRGSSHTKASEILYGQTPRDAMSSGQALERERVAAEYRQERLRVQNIRERRQHGIDYRSFLNLLIDGESNDHTRERYGLSKSDALRFRDASQSLKHAHKRFLEHYYPVGTSIEAHWSGAGSGWKETPAGKGMISGYEVRKDDKNNEHLFILVDWPDGSSHALSNCDRYSVPLPEQKWNKGTPLPEDLLPPYPPVPGFLAR